MLFMSSSHFIRGLKTNYKIIKRMKKRILFSFEPIDWLPFLSVFGLKKGTVGKPALVLFLLSFVTCTLHAQISLQWVKQLGGGFDMNRELAPGPEALNNISRKGHSVTTDANNNILVTGFYSDSTDFGNGVWMIPPANHKNVMFLAKYDSAGNFLFVKNFYGLGNPTHAMLGHMFENTFVRTDEAGNVYMTFGLEGGQADLDPGVGVIAGQAGKYYLVKLTDKGNFVKATMLPNFFSGRSSSTILDNIYKITATHFYVMFQYKIYRYSLNLDLDLTIDVRVSSGLEYNELSYTGLTSFDVDDNGVIYCTFLNAKNNCELSSNVGPKPWLLKYAANGSRIWTKPFISSDISLYKNRLKATSYLPYQRQIDVDPGIDSFFVSGSAEFPGFVADFDTAGQFLHAHTVSRFVSKNYNRSGSAAATSITGTNSISDMNNTNDSLRYYYEGKSGSSTFLARGFTDFIVSLSDDYDNLISLTHFGGVGDEKLYDWTVDKSGNMILVGTFSHADDCDYDPGPNTVKLINTNMVPHPVFHDRFRTSIFVLKLKLNP